MSNPNAYSVGWICAINVERVVAQAFLDEEHHTPESVGAHDNNVYQLGKIGKHNVVIASLPDGEYGIAAAASVARDMLNSFPNIRIGLLVGIGGGAPTDERDIRLGDIVVSAPRDGKGGVLQYDFGKTIQNQAFQITGFLNQPPGLLRSAVADLASQYELKGHNLEDEINATLKNHPKLQKKYSRPDVNSDRLYRSEVAHPISKEGSCEDLCGIDQSTLRLRRPRIEDENNPAIHYGLIASANQLMKDAVIRDKLAAEKGVLCFEMEAAGLMNHFPCLVVRGICDYSDSHKNKVWQGYAAMTAAAYAKNLLYRIPPSKVEAEKRIMDDIHSGIKELVDEHRNKIHDDVLEWLTPVNYAPRQHAILNRRQHGTGKWFLNSSEFKEWVDTDKQTLFCPGIPGAGKTILTSTVVEELTNRFGKDKTIGIAYLYCDFRQKAEQTAKALIMSLLKQLIQDWSSLPDSVRSLYDKHSDKGSRPSLEEISGIFLSVADAYSRVFIIIDALDECQEKGGYPGGVMTEIFRLQSKTSANIFVTSRDLPEIVERFKDSGNIKIEAKEQDVQAYLDEHVSELPKWVDQQLQQEIKRKIGGAIDGMFLLARLYIDSLKEETSPGDITTVLENIRTGSEAYDYAYETAMERIQRQRKGYRQLAMRVLSWITCTKRPLRLSELNHALAIEVEKSGLDENKIPRVELASVCAGLITVDEESNIVRLVHYTTQEYFVRTQQKWFPDANESIARSCITYLNFDVFGDLGFCSSDTDFEKRLDSNPLYDYAARFWGDHARTASTKVEELTLRFLESEKKTSAAGQAVMVSGTAPDYSQRVPREITRLHLAAYFGLVEIVHILLSEGHEANPRDSQGQTPLSLAAASGHDSVVSFLRDRPGVDVNCKDRHGRTPMSLAAENGHEAVVKELLKAHGVDIRSKDEFGQTPLSRAIANHHDAVYSALTENKRGRETREEKLQDGAHLLSAVKAGSKGTVSLLLKHVDCDFKDESGRTPLSWAAENGDNLVMQLLLDKGAHVETQDDSGLTPLAFAVKYGRKDVIQTLLDHGARSDSKDHLGRTPMWHAACGGLQNIIGLLLQKRESETAEGNHPDDDGFTPLLCAADRGHIDAVRLFLKRQVGVELHENDGKTRPQYARDIVKLLKDDDASLHLNNRSLLLQATDRGHINVAKFLLGRSDLTNNEGIVSYSYADGVIKLLLNAHSVDVDFQDESGQTLLSHSAQRRHEDVARLLLDNDADIELESISRRTPLSLAAESGSESIVRLLLGKGPNIEPRDIVYGRTPLSWAVESRNVTIVQLLLDAGADIESRSSSGRTPLSWAAESGHEAITRLLLESSAVIESRDSSGRTPLLWAAEGGHKAVVQLLVNRGANIESRDESGQTVLSWAAKSGSVAIVQLLLDKAQILSRKIRGANIESKDNYGESILLWAARNGREAIVQLLLDKAPDIELRDRAYGRTPLLWAAEEGHEAIIWLLVDNGANMESNDESGQTILLWAARRGNAAVVQRLLDKGANVNIKEQGGSTPLAWAIENGSMDIIKILLQRGAAVDYAYVPPAGVEEWKHAPWNWRGRGQAAIIVVLAAGVIIGACVYLGISIQRVVISTNQDPKIGIYFKWAGAGLGGLISFGFVFVFWTIFWDRQKKKKKGATLRSPLLRAIEKRQYAVVQLLINHQARRDFYGNLLYTPLALGKKIGDETIINILKRPNNITYAADV